MKGSLARMALPLVLLALAVQAGTAHAGDAPQEITIPQDSAIFRGYSPKPYLLAEADTSAPASNAAANVASANPAKPGDFQERTLTLDKTHKFFGVSTIVAALATAATAPESCEQNCSATAQQPRQRNGTHAHLARVTVGLAAATILTGILAHWDDIHPGEGITDPDNLHAILGVTGAVLMLKAVNKSAGSTVPVAHAAQAELGAALMAIGIKMEW